MATYSNLDPETLRFLLTHYDLGTVNKVRPLKGGQANSSFKLETDTGIFVLSICDEKSLSEVRVLTRVLGRLGEYGFPTTRVVRTLDGSSAVDLDGKPVFVKTYIEGQVPGRITAGMLFQVGRQLARLHRIPAPDGVPGQFAYGWERFDEVLDADTDDAYRKWLAEKQDYLRKTLTGDLPLAMIHGDLFYDNTLFDGDRLVAVLDFEEVCVYYRAFDIGMCVVGFCAKDNDVSLETFRALVAGYQSETVLTKKEQQQLQALSVLGAAATSFWRFRQYNLIHPGSPLSQNYVQMNRLADAWQAFSANDFQQSVFS